MSLLSDIKFLMKKYIKNPILIAAGAYLLWRFVNKQKKRENFCESIKIIEDEEDKAHSIIFDEKTKKYVLILHDKVFSSDSVEDLRKMIGDK